jgi:hypothetical protein
MNEWAEKIRGTRVSLDLVDAMNDALTGDKTAAERVGRIAGEIFSNVPIGQTLMSWYPEYGLELPNGNRLPTREKFFGGESTVRYGSGLLALEGLKDPLSRLILPYAGVQIKRSKDGYAAFRAGYYMRGEERIDFNQTPENFTKAVLFGKYSIPDKNAAEKERLKMARESSLKLENKERAELKSYINKSVGSGLKIKDILMGVNREDRKKALEIYKSSKEKKAATSPLEQIILKTGSNASKLAILREASKDYKTVAEYRRALVSLANKHLISKDLAKEALKGKLKS